MDKTPDFLTLLNGQLDQLFHELWRLSLTDPKQAFFALKMLKAAKAAAGRRRSWEAQGQHVPPFLIYSVTNNCNLNCRGCYSHRLHHPKGPELPPARVRALFSEAAELGIPVILLGGGEPMMRPEVLTAAAERPDIIFPVFTNGLLIEGERMEMLVRARNIIPVISVDGGGEKTDSRRGEGVFDRILQVTGHLAAHRKLYGVSLTVTAANLAEITDQTYIERLLGAGCKAFLFIEYVPVDEGTEHLVPDQAQRDQLVRSVDAYRERYPGLFIAFPAGEEEMGGCLASGRGFVHINAQGDLEPCPFAPYSDSNLRERTLRECLDSRLLASIRDEHHKLDETTGGCALWRHREWVKSLIH